ncbi:hypothetical protein ABZS66_59075 [Dactylosporangium sp. NPDC005572]|uniref:hypothetical protein n=1 Tax=Dactylosporangium sp. NPDC005572 TaxID=3156889 RepID=UPI0033BB3D56
MPRATAGLFVRLKLVSVEHIGTPDGDAWLRKQPTATSDSRSEAAIASGVQLQATASLQFPYFRPSFSAVGTMTSALHSGSTTATSSRAGQEITAPTVVVRSRYQATIALAASWNRLRFWVRRPSPAPAVEELFVIEEVPAGIYRAAVHQAVSPKHERWVSDNQPDHVSVERRSPADSLVRAVGAFIAFHGRIGNRTLDDSFFTSPQLRDLVAALDGRLTQAADVSAADVWQAVTRTPNVMVLIHVRPPNRTSHLYWLLADDRTGDVLPRWVDTQVPGLFDEVSQPSGERYGQLSAPETELLVLDGDGRVSTVVDLLQGGPSV